MTRRLIILSLLLIGLCSGFAGAQERVGSLDRNPLLKGRKPSLIQARSTAVSLPIFEDFTGYSPYPDSTIWADDHVYVNNTMPSMPVSRGVATFDALNRYGLPYDTLYNSAVVYADSLTLKPLDISTLQPSDSVFLSFYYQPQGLGFGPELQDSLLLLFKKSNGTWVKVWSKEGSGVHPFKQVILPLNDTSYFHTNFQFRFVNKASINTNDDTWNIDYIRMDANRSSTDTAINDLAFISDPGFMLNDYTYMPYRHFMANPGGELATQMLDSVRNGYSSAQNINYAFTARESVSNTPLFSTGFTTVNISQYINEDVSQAVYTNTVPLVDPFAKVIFENKFYIQSLNGSDKKVNDTVIKEQVFDNYLAYDDGTAEKSYYLNLFASLPGKIAIEHHLNVADTLQGIDIYFGRQVPVGSGKMFSIAVYKKLQGVNGATADQLLYQQDFMYPRYMQVNNYCTYKLENPVVLPAGAFYIATIQPALSGSDSLYIGLDVNRAQGNHAYYNVDGTWNESTITGAIMMRPLLGTIVFNTIVNDPEEGALNALEENAIYPNPATDKVVCDNRTDKPTKYYLSDIQGRLIQSAILPANKQIDISTLVPGMYIIRLETNGLVGKPQKLIKQ